MTALRLNVAFLAALIAFVVSTCAARPEIAGGSAPSPSQPLPSSTADLSTQTCEGPPFFFTQPPYASFRPVPGISVRVIDKGTFEISNATDRDYFFGVSSWAAEDNLLCGRGVVGHTDLDGRLRAGATIHASGGSTPEVPAVDVIWAERCGEGRSGAPDGGYVLPLSTVEPPAPVAD